MQSGALAPNTAAIGKSSNDRGPHWWSRDYGDAAERKHDRDIPEQIQLALKRGTRMDTDKFKNELMIGETSSIEFKRFEMACLVVKHPVKVRYDT